MDARQPVSVAVEAVVTRSDGTVENLGTVAYWHRNPLKRIARRLAGTGTATPPLPESPPMHRIAVTEGKTTFQWRNAYSDGEQAARDLEQAEREFPDGRVHVQELVADGDNSTWKDVK